jgi:hypothetical protein
MPSATSNTLSSTELRVEEARLVKDQPNTKILPLTGGYPQLEYPWVQAPNADAAAKQAAAELLQGIQGPAGSDARQKQGLLNPGATAVAQGALPGTPAGALLPAPTMDEIPTLYALADAGAQHGNILGVLDVSGSMNYPTGPGQPSEMAAVQDSGKLALPLLSDQTRMGLWEFSYQLDPPRDYLQVLPMAPLSSSRDQLLQALDAATPRSTGNTSGTSLYATVLAAYKDVQANWQAGYANSVLVFTDGRDEDDPGAPSLASLQTQLKAIEDPAKPIQLIMLGYGNADIGAMTAITNTVGGSVYHINTKVQIVGAFIDAISHSVLNSLTQS